LIKFIANLYGISIFSSAFNSFGGLKYSLFLVVIFLSVYPYLVKDDSHGVLRERYISSRQESIPFALPPGELVRRTCLPEKAGFLPAVGPKAYQTRNGVNGQKSI